MLTLYNHNDGKEKDQLPWFKSLRVTVTWMTFITFNKTATPYMCKIKAIIRAAYKHGYFQWSVQYVFSCVCIYGELGYCVMCLQWCNVD